MSISSNYLLSLYGSGTGSASSGSLLNTAYGIGTGAGSSSGTDPVAALNAAEANQTADVAQTAVQSGVQTALAAFTKGVNSATSVSQLLANPAVLNVLLTAAGIKGADVEPEGQRLAGQHLDRHALENPGDDL
jgi:hypothetical protein